MLLHRLLLLSLAAALTPSNACFLDLFGVCGGANKIANELDKLPDKIRDAAEELLDHFFNEDLPPAINKLTAAAKSLMDRAEKEYEDAINATRVQLEELAEAIVKDVEDVAKDVTKDVEDIVKLVSKELLKDVSKIIADIDTRVNMLITRLENDGKELFCALTGYIDTFEKQFASLFSHKHDCECTQSMLASNPGLAEDCECSSCFHIGNIYPKCPCKPWGLQFAPGWYNHGKYEYLKCHLYKPINWTTWTVDMIVNQLTIVQEAALSFRCLEDLQPGSTLNRQYFSDEFTNLTYSILLWTSNPADERLKHWNAVNFAASDPNPCSGKTVEQCVEQAMTDLGQAKADLNAAKTDLDSAKDSFASKSDVQADIDAVKSNVQGNIDTVKSDLQDSIDAVRSAVPSLAANGLTSYSCNCASYKGGQSICYDSGKVAIGFMYYCSTDSCLNSQVPAMDTDKDQGITCCDVCVGTAADARLALASAPRFESQYMGDKATTSKHNLLF